MWVRVDLPRAAEIALVVTDSHQRQGIGTTLVRALTDELARRGIEQAQAVSSPGNRAVRRMLARAVPAAAPSYEQGLTTWTFSTSRLPGRRGRVSERGQGPPRQCSMRRWSGRNPLRTPHRTAWVRLSTSILR